MACHNGKAKWIILSHRPSVDIFMKIPPTPHILNRIPRHEPSELRRVVPVPVIVQPRFVVEPSAGKRERIGEVVLLRIPGSDNIGVSIWNPPLPTSFQPLPTEGTAVAAVCDTKPPCIVYSLPALWPFLQRQGDSARTPNSAAVRCWRRVDSEGC